ncbi:MAG: hypothetical protein JST93_28450 [Acidobacteria bacterium]|nr:hypothetical protein [Acidobacteriota bacterium]
MIPQLLLLLVSIETSPDGEARLRFTLERPAAVTYGVLTVELEESVFEGITGFTIHSVSGEETGVALIEGRKAHISFSSRNAAVGRVADRPVLTIRASTRRAPAFEDVKVQIESRAWAYSTSVSYVPYDVVVRGGPIPADIPEETFDAVPAIEGRVVCLPKVRLVSGSTGIFRTFVGGGVALRNPHSFPVSVLFQTVGTLGDVRQELEMRLAPFTSHYQNVGGVGPLSDGYMRVHATSELEMAHVSRPMNPITNATSIATSSMTPTSVNTLRYSVGPDVLTWAWQRGEPAPASKTLRLTSDWRERPTAHPRFRTKVSAPWIKVTPDGGEGDAELAVSIDPSGLAPGVYRETVVIEPLQTEIVRGVVPVTAGLVVSISTPARQRVSISHAELRIGSDYQHYVILGDRPFTTTVHAGPPGNWLAVNPRNFTQPDILLELRPNLLGPGQYAAHVLVKGERFTEVVQATLRMPGGTSMEDAQNGARPRLDANECSFDIGGAERALCALVEAGGPLQFESTLGETPAAKTISVRAPGAVSASVATDSGGNWLSVLGTAGSLTIAPNAAGLAAGVYTGIVTFTSPQAAGPTQVPVVMVIHAPLPPDPMIASPPVLDFPRESYLSWVRVTSGNMTEPLQVTVEPGSGVRIESQYPALWMFEVSGWNFGQGSASIQLKTSKQSMTVPVRFHTVESGPSNQPALAAILNAASQRPMPLVPGALVSFLGAGFQSVMVENKTLYPLQNIAIPADVVPGTEVTVVLESYGARRVLRLPVAEAAPGVFTTDGSGKGVAVVRNANGTPNGADHRAQRGSVVWLQATGLKSDDVVVDAGGVQARAMNVFPFEEGVAGRDWIEFAMPADAPVGEVPVTVISAGVRSQKGVTILVE